MSVFHGLSGGNAAHEPSIAVPAGSELGTVLGLVEGTVVGAAVGVAAGAAVEPPEPLGALGVLEPPPPHAASKNAAARYGITCASGRMPFDCEGTATYPIDLTRRDAQHGFQTMGRARRTRPQHRGHVFCGNRGRT